jgi:tetratricopeptide (TPR) repeat protein
VGFGILWVFLHLLPTNSVVPRLDVANERQLYLAGWGVFLLIGAALAQLLRATLRPQIVSVLSVLIVVGLGAATVLRNEAYRTEVTLWEATVRESPAKARAYNNLGYAYALAGRPDEAERAYRTALRLNPDFQLARQNLALLRKE